MSENKKRKIEYQCHYCDKAYKKPSKLDEHERSHTGEVNTCINKLFTVLITLVRDLLFALSLNATKLL